MNDLGLHVAHVPLRLGWKPVRLHAQLQKIYHERPDGHGGMAACDTWDNATLHCALDLPGQPGVPLVLETKRMSPTDTNTWEIDHITAARDLNNHIALVGGGGGGGESTLESGTLGGGHLAEVGDGDFVVGTVGRASADATHGDGGAVSKPFNDEGAVGKVEVGGEQGGLLDRRFNDWGLVVDDFLTGLGGGFGGFLNDVNGGTRFGGTLNSALRGTVRRGLPEGLRILTGGVSTSNGTGGRTSSGDR